MEESLNSTADTSSVPPTSFGSIPNTNEDSMVREDWVPAGTPNTGPSARGDGNTSSSGAYGLSTMAVENEWSAKAASPPPAAPLTPGSLMTPRTEVILFKEGLSEYVSALGSAGMKNIGDLARSGVRASDLQIFGISNPKHQDRLLVLSERRLQQEKAAEPKPNEPAQTSLQSIPAPRLNMNNNINSSSSSYQQQQPLIMPPSPQSLRDQINRRERPAGAPHQEGPSDRIHISIISSRSAPAPGGVHGSPPPGITPKPPRLRADCEYSVRVGLCDFVSGSIKSVKNSAVSTKAVMGPIPVFVQGSSSSHKPNFMSATAMSRHDDNNNAAATRVGSAKRGASATTSHEAALSVRTRLGRAGSQAIGGSASKRAGRSKSGASSDGEDGGMCVEHDESANDPSRLICHTNFQTSCILVELIEHIGRSKTVVVGASVFPMSFFHRFDSSTIVDSWFPVRELKAGEGCVMETMVVYDAMMHPLRTPIHMGVSASSSLTPLGGRPVAGGGGFAGNSPRMLARASGNTSSNSLLGDSNSSATPLQPPSTSRQQPPLQNPAQPRQQQGATPSPQRHRASTIRGKNPPVVAMVRLAFQVPGGCPKQLSKAFHIKSINMGNRHLYLSVFDMCVFKTTGEAQTFRDDWQRVLSGDEAVAFSSMQLAEWHRQASGSTDGGPTGPPQAGSKRGSLRRPAAADTIALLNKPLENQYCSIRMDGLPKGTARRSKVVQEATYRPQFNQQFGWGDEVTESKCISLRLKQRKGGLGKPEIIGAAHVPIQYFMSKPADHAEKVVLLMDVHNPYIIRAACFVRLQILASKDAPQMEVADGPVDIPSRIEQIAAYQEAMEAQRQLQLEKSGNKGGDSITSPLDGGSGGGGEDPDFNWAPPAGTPERPVSAHTESPSPIQWDNFNASGELDRRRSVDSMNDLVRRVDSDYTDAERISPRYTAAAIGGDATWGSGSTVGQVGSGSIQHSSAPRLRTYDDLVSPYDVQLGNLDPVPEDNFFSPNKRRQQEHSPSLPPMGVSDAFLANVGRIDSTKRGRSPTLSLLRGIEDGNNSLSSRTLSLVPSSPTLSLSGHADSIGPSVLLRSPSLSLSTSPTLSALGTVNRASSRSTPSSPSSLSSTSSSSSSSSTSLSTSRSSTSSTSSSSTSSSASSPSPRRAQPVGTDEASPTATARTYDTSTTATTVGSPSQQQQTLGSPLTFSPIGIDLSDSDTDKESPARGGGVGSPQSQTKVTPEASSTTSIPPALPQQEARSVEPSLEPLFSLDSFDVDYPPPSKRPHSPQDGFPSTGDLLLAAPGDSMLNTSTNSILVTTPTHASGKHPSGLASTTPRKRSVQFVGQM